MSIKIENVQVFGWEMAIRGARNPMNSWPKSDSWFIDAYIPENQNYFAHDMNGWTGHINLPLDSIDVIKGETEMLHPPKFREYDYKTIIGLNDHKLLMNLCKGGTEEAKWRRMVHVQMDITAPLYWWKEFETYKVGTVSNSCSTMHKIHAKEFTLEDFSCEHLISGEDIGDTAEELWEAGAFSVEMEHDPTLTYVNDTWYAAYYAKDVLLETIDALNHYREKFLETKDKKYWWQMIQLLPSSYNQRRTIDLNYEVLAAQYRQRKEHKLDCWRHYCEWIKTLPYSEFITGEVSDETEHVPE